MNIKNPPSHWEFDSMRRFAGTYVSLVREPRLSGSEPLRAPQHHVKYLWQRGRNTRPGVWFVCLFYCFTASRYSGNKVHTSTHTDTHILTHTDTNLHTQSHIHTHTHTHIHIYANMHTVHLLSSTSLPEPPALRRVRLSPSVLMFA